MSTVSSQIKRLYNNFLKNNPQIRFSSLKTYIRKLSQSGTDAEKSLIKTWLSHKKGILEKAAKAERLKNKGAELTAIKLATKNARRKTK